MIILWFYYGIHIIRNSESPQPDWLKMVEIMPDLTFISVMFQRQTQTKSCMVADSDSARGIRVRCTILHMNITSLCYGDLLTVKYYKIYNKNWLFIIVIVQNPSPIASSPHIQGVAFYLRCYTMDSIELCMGNWLISILWYFFVGFLYNIKNKKM